ncbi:substance-P receptor-like [Littorina saxatilis]|uniref:substance-P receptor-like n=1 Tax=Littorina saxatilis TaxID=31220 RepID=UPI0038B4453B
MNIMDSTIERSFILVRNDTYRYNCSAAGEEGGENLSMATNMTTQNPYDVPTGLICLLAFLYGSISLLAVLGNSLVIVIIVRNRRMHTVTNIFIANLAVADVIIGMFSIPFQFQAALLQRWVLADFMCSLAPMVQVISVNVSIFTLTVIAMDRYIAVLHPFRAGCSPKSAAIIITVTWVLAIVLSLPYPMYYWVDTMPDRDSPWCSLHPPPQFPNFFVYYTCFLVALQYLFPLLVISFCYCRIAWHIWGSRRPGTNLNTTEDVRGRNKRKVVKMMIIVVCLFVLCWLPLQTYNFLSVVNENINMYKYINIIWFCSNWLAMSNSCYNPFIYGILNAKFKREFRQLFSFLPSRCMSKPPKDYYSDYYSEDSHQHHVMRRNHNQYRHAALRYNFCRDEARKLFPPRAPGGDRTETSQI